MIHHKRLRPPSRDYPGHRGIIEKGSIQNSLAQLETMLAATDTSNARCPRKAAPTPKTAL